jgi:hypothetical protein
MIKQEQLSKLHEYKIAKAFVNRFEGKVELMWQMMNEVRMAGIIAEGQVSLR